MDPDPTRLSICETARLLAGGQISSVELVEAYLAVIAERNPELNAIVTLCEEEAREAAASADAARSRRGVSGLLEGIPFTLKDSLETKGIRTTCGSERLRDHIPERDSTVAARLQGAGGILLGKTNLPEGCRGFQTENALFGRTCHPEDAGRTPGGSTGGGAAAVAAGMSPLEIGSDLGGSVRIPAHFCGLYGFTATNHRISRMGHIPEWPGRLRGLRTMGVLGPLTRSLEDLDLVYRVLAGPDPDWPLMPPVPLGDRVQLKGQKLKLGWADRFPNLPIEEDYAEVIRVFLKDLEGAGVQLSEGLPAGFSVEAAWEAFGGIRGAETTASLSREETAVLLEKLGFREDSEIPMDRGHYRGALGDLRDYTAFLSTRDELTRILEAHLDVVDALLLPVTSMAAFPHRPGEEDFEICGQTVPYWLAGTGFTNPFNLTGHPVVVLPIGRNGDGLPLGIQIVGKRWEEAKLLAVAEAICCVAG